MELEVIMNQLKEKKCRITPKRQALIEILYANKDILLTAEEITSLCLEKSQDLNTTTVYRNLELLQSMGLLYTMNVDRHTVAYKLICHNHHHHHLICSNCGKMESIDYCPINNELLEQINKKGYVLKEHSLKLFGLCENCKDPTN